MLEKGRERSVRLRKTLMGRERRRPCGLGRVEARDGAR